MHSLYDKAKKLIDSSKNVLIISHRKPDPDTVGAAMCLNYWLSGMSKSVTLACVDSISPKLSFLPGVDKYVKEFDIFSYDLIIIVDAGASDITNFHLKYENLFNAGVPILNIDHHISNDNFGDVNIVQPNSASTTIILYEMFVYFGVSITSDMATSLLTGIYSDTGSFMHSNTDEYVLSIASELLKFGAKLAIISSSLFRSRPVSSLRLLGRVLEKAIISSEDVVMSVVENSDYDETGSNPEQLSGVIDYLNMVPGSKFAVLINEDRKGNVKGSFRTRNDAIDLAQLAATFGGGGHAKASGFSIPGTLHGDVKYTIVTDNLSKKTLDF